MTPERDPLQIDELKAIQKRFMHIFVLMALLCIGLVMIIIFRMSSATPPGPSERATLWGTVTVAVVMLTMHYAYLRRTDRQSRQHLEKLTFLDALTGAYNNRYFEMALAAEVKRARRHGRPLCMAYIDLDNFKPVNDTLGHAVGNRVLADLGRLFLASARESDTVGRIGGDEFAVLLPETDMAGARIFAERTRERVERYTLQVSPDAQVDGVRCSIGVVELPDGEITPDEFLKMADAAMYRAKKAGGNRVCA